jgi:RNA binding exosome subunit
MIDVKSIPVLNVARELFGEEGRDRSTRTEKHFPGNAGLFVNVEKNLWYSQGHDTGGDAASLVMYAQGGEFRGAAEWLCEHGFAKDEQPKLNGKSHGAGKFNIVAEYDYPDENGEVLFQAVRLDPKDFRQRRKPRPEDDPSKIKGGWVWSLEGVRRVPYRLPELLEGVSMGHPVYIAEGEKGVEALARLGVIATCSPMGAGKWRDEYNEHLAGADVVILPDNDKPGEDHADMVAKSLKGVAAQVTVLRLAGLSKGADVADWIAAGGTAEDLAQAAGLAAEAREPEAKTRLKQYCIHDLIALDIPPREMLLDPIIPEKGLAMVYAMRGTGKTHLACGCSYAVATGTPFLKWTGNGARRVLHCDGEMAADELRGRFAEIMKGSKVKPDRGMLNILTADLLEFGIGNLAEPSVQQELEPLLVGVELLVLDNLSSLTAVIRDNDAESWNPIQAWLLRLRRRGTSVLIVHHAGKGGEQRGTSRREDVLDTSISLRRPSDFKSEEGARFEIHYEKVRGVYGEKIRPFEAKMETREGASWSLREIADVNFSRVKALLDDDMTVRDIADETGLSKSTVGRIKKQIEALAMAPGNLTE